MADNLQIIMSGTFKGAGLMQGGSYWTVDYQLDQDLFNEATAEMVVETSMDKAQENQDLGLIDELANIDGQPIYILSGNLDDIAPPKAQEAQRTIYESYGANVMYEAEDIYHVFPVDYPTDEWPRQSCDGSDVYLCNNGFDSAGKILGHLLTNIPETGMTELAPKDYDWESKGVFEKFRQHNFVDWWGFF